MRHPIPDTPAIPHRKGVLFIHVIAAGLGITGVLLRNSDSLADSVFGLIQGLAILFVVVTLMNTAECRHVKQVQDEVARLEEIERDTTN